MANELVLNEAFEYEVISGIASRIKTRNAVFQNFYGVGPDGPNTDQIEGDEGRVDIFDSVQDAAKAVAAGANYPQDSPDPAGKFDYTCIRAAMERRFTGVNFARLREIGGSSAMKDRAGRRYLQRQMTNFTSKFRTLREVALVGMFRDSLYLKPSGQEMIPTFTATGAIKINFQIPADHKDQLGGIIGASWYTAGTGIVDDAYQILAFGESEAGEAPTEWWWNGDTWRQAILGNTQIKDLAGTSSRIWISNEFDRTDNVRTVVLAGMPEVTHRIIDHKVKVDGSLVKYVPDDVVIMTPRPEPGMQWLRGIEGSDYYGPLPGEELPIEVFGELFYMMWDGDRVSTAAVLRGNDIFIPNLQVPKATLVADVTP